VAPCGTLWSQTGWNNTLGSNQFCHPLNQPDVQYMDNLTKVWGKHATKVGFEHQHLRFTILQPPSGRGAWSFSGAYSEVPSQGGAIPLGQMLLIPIKSTVAGDSICWRRGRVQASNYANTIWAVTTTLLIFRTIGK